MRVAVATDACGAGASRVARLVGVAVSGHDLAAREDGESVLPCNELVGFWWIQD
jgi:hypothetical protein